MGRTLILSKANKKIYRDGDVLTKVFDHALMGKSKVIHEAWAQSLVEQTRLNVPKVLKIYPEGKDWAIDSQFIEGRSLLSIMEAPNADWKGGLDRLIALQMAVFQSPCVGLPDMKDKFNRKISDLGKETDPNKHVEATIRYELHVCLDRMPAHRKLCHGDFLPDNVLIAKDNQAYLFDWAHATLGNASSDAANTYLQLVLDGKKEWAEYYLKAFAKASDTAIQYIRSWFPVVAATMLDKQSDPLAIAFLVKQINLIEFQ